MPEVGTTGTTDIGAFGERVRLLRRERGQTLEELSRASGVSRAMISKVERGEKSPTVTVAAGIAAGLGVEVARLLGGEERRRGFVLPRSRQMVLRDPQSGYERRLLAGAQEGGRELEFVRDEVPPGGRAEALDAGRAGVSGHLAVERGRVRVRLGEEVHDLEEGDALAFEADGGCEVENRGEETAIVYRILRS